MVKLPEGSFILKIQCTENKIVACLKLKAFTDNNIKLAHVAEFICDREEKREKKTIPSISPFPTLFSKGFFPGILW